MVDFSITPPKILVTWPVLQANIVPKDNFTGWVKIFWEYFISTKNTLGYRNPRKINSGVKIFWDNFTSGKGNPRKTKPLHR